MPDWILIPVITDQKLREGLEKIGFQFGEEEKLEDEEFGDKKIAVILPPGWHMGLRKQCDRLYDASGNWRAHFGIYRGVYSANFNRCFFVDDYFSLFNTKNDRARLYVEIHKWHYPGNETVFRTEIIETSANDRQKRDRDIKSLYDKAYTWLNEKFPDWQNPLAYWD